MTDKTGGPAFPRPHSGTSQFAQQGMTLRDYFAAKAMQTYIADKDLIDMYCFLEKNVKQEVATTAYQMADAMLKAREQ